MLLQRHVSFFLKRANAVAVAECQRILGDHAGLELRLFKEELNVVGTLPAEDPIHLEITNLQERFGFRLTNGLHAQFTDNDIDQAELLALRPNNYVAQTPPESTGTRYDIIVICPTCGLRRREQRGPLFLSGAAKLTGKKWSKPLEEGTFLISPDLAEMFAEWQVSGCTLQEVRTCRGGVLTIKQVVPTWILPAELHSSTPYKPGANLCPVCRQLGRYPLQLVYGRAAVGDIHDIGLAPIYYSLGLQNASPATLVVSQRVYRLMKGARVGGFVVEPIDLV